MADSQRKSRPPVARPFAIPKGQQPKIDAIRRLTQDIARLAAHFCRDPRHWRNLPARQSLERKHEQRAAALAALKEQVPEKYKALLQDLNLTERNPS